MEELADFDYSVRVNVANSALCDGQREASVALKLRLKQAGKGKERQVGACEFTHGGLEKKLMRVAAFRQVMLELNEAQLADLLHKFASINKVEHLLR